MTNPKVWSQPSQLFPILFGQTYMARRVTILDVGGARSKTVEFFSQFKCRLHIVDLYSAEILRNPSVELSPKELQQEFTKLLKLPEGSALDICLFWDLFNYLDVKQIKAFCVALRPHLHRGSRGHGFGARNAETLLADLEYAIEGVDSFFVNQRRLDRLPCYPMAQAKLKSEISCFSIDRGTLFADGRQEMLLKAKL